MTPTEAALHDAWDEVAAACMEGDQAHERRALAELARLQQRESAENDCA